MKTNQYWNDSKKTPVTRVTNPVLAKYMSRNKESVNTKGIPWPYDDSSGGIFVHNAMERTQKSDSEYLFEVFQDNTAPTS